MGGKASKAVAKKALRPLKSIHLEERAQKAVDQHKVNPVPAPRHPSTEKIFEKHVAGPEKSSSDHPEIKEELAKHDDTLISRVNKLHLDQISDMPKIKSKERPLPQSRELIMDPLNALEEPKNIPKGKISFRQLGVILEKSREEPTMHQAEVIAKEYNLDLQDTINLIKYFQKIKMEDLIDPDEMKKREERRKSPFKVDIDYGAMRNKPS